MKDVWPNYNALTLRSSYIRLLWGPKVSSGKLGYLKLHSGDSKQTYNDERNKKKIQEKLKKNKREKVKLS